MTTSGLAWAAGSTVHLSDGTTIDTGGPVRMFVVAGDGVFFVPAPTEEDAGSSFHDGELTFAAPGQPTTGTGLRVAARYVGASEDDLAVGYSESEMEIIAVTPGDSVALMSCEVPLGKCEVFEETAGQTVIFPIGSTLGDGLILQDGDEL